MIEFAHVTYKLWEKLLTSMTIFHIFLQPSDDEISSEISDEANDVAVSGKCLLFFSYHSHLFIFSLVS